MTTSTGHLDRWLMIACYALWLAIILGVGWILSQTHTLLLEISLELRFNPWVARAVRQLSLPVLGLFWLVFLFWLEHYLRKGVQEGRFVKRALRVSGATIGVGLLIVIVRSVMS